MAVPACPQDRARMNAPGRRRSPASFRRTAENDRANRTGAKGSLIKYRETLCRHPGHLNSTFQVETPWSAHTHVAQRPRPAVAQPQDPHQSPHRRLWATPRCLIRGILQGGQFHNLMRTTGAQHINPPGHRIISTPGLDPSPYALSGGGNTCGDDITW